MLGEQIRDGATSLEIHFLNLGPPNLRFPLPLSSGDPPLLHRHHAHPLSPVRARPAASPGKQVRDDAL